MFYNNTGGVYNKVELRRNPTSTAPHPRYALLRHKAIIGRDSTTLLLRHPHDACDRLLVLNRVDGSGDERLQVHCVRVAFGIACARGGAAVL